MSKTVKKINRDDATNGVAGKRGVNPDGAVVHNDYGAMSPEEYLPWLIRRRDARQLDLGFAHYYSGCHAILRAGNTDYAAWHTAHKIGNKMYLGYEVVQSYYGVISDEEFMLNEDMTLRQVAEDFHYYKLKPNRNTIKLHKEFVSTSCPHRSWDIHGKSLNSVKDYFIKKVAYYMSLGKTVEEMLKNEGVKAPEPSKPNNVTPQPDGKTLKVGTQAKFWETGSAIPSFVIGGVYDVLASKPVNKSRSKKAYLIGKGKIATGWLLEQDVDGFKTAGGGNTNKATPTTKPVVTAGNPNSASIGGVQAYLNLTYNAGLNVDGKLGPATKKAFVVALQKEINAQFKGNLKVDGVFGNATANAFKTVRSGAKGNLTRLIQAALIMNNYAIGKFDGDFGTSTVSAVKRFQANRGLSVDGVVGSGTLRKLVL